MLYLLYQVSCWSVPIPEDFDNLYTILYYSPYLYTLQSDMEKLHKQIQGINVTSVHLREE